MKIHIKQPKAKFTNIPYLSNTFDVSEEIVSPSTTVPENIIVDHDTSYIDVLCTLQARSEFPPVTVSAKYRNEIGDELSQMNFNLYDNTSINLNGIVSHVDVIAEEIVAFWDTFQFDNEISLNDITSVHDKVIYTKTFKITEKSQSVRVSEIENYSGIDTISDVYYLGGNYKPYKTLADIQPYLFYLGHYYNNEPFINIISATDFLNTKNNLKPASNVKFEELSTLQDDIMAGQIQIKINDKLYKSIYAVKNTLTVPMITVRFKIN